MPKLVPNPLSDLAEPLARMERSLQNVERSLQKVERLLQDVHRSREPLAALADDSAATRGATEAVVRELSGLRKDLAGAEGAANGKTRR